VLLLDEPAAGMTAAERARLAQVLRGLAGNGSAVLLVEHDMRLVGAVADRVTVLDQGRVLAVGHARAGPRRPGRAPRLPRRERREDELRRLALLLLLPACAAGGSGAEQEALFVVSRR
jgi:energy-coupling factor transporter ATP-binding protein EcfA2